MADFLKKSAIFAAFLLKTARVYQEEICRNGRFPPENSGDSVHENCLGTSKKPRKLRIREGRKSGDFPPIFYPPGILRNRGFFGS